MNAQEVIASGLLEAYAFGQTDPEETLLVERSLMLHSEVRKELDAIESALEKYAVLMAVVPPTQVKGSISRKVGTVGAKKETPVLVLPPAPAIAPKPAFNWLAAAAVAGLVLSAGMNFLQYQELHAVRGELARLEDDRSVLAEELQVQRTSMERTNAQLAVVLDPRAEIVRLDGMGDAAGKSARVYWDKNAQAVHFDAQAMPPPPDGMQYQLWALVDGQPVDAGVIALDGDHLQRMKDVPMAQAFAVTVETAGGSPTPNLSALVLMGQV